MSDSEQAPTFDDTLQKWIEENKLKPLDREILVHDDLAPTFYGIGTFGVGPRGTSEAIEGQVQSAHIVAAAASRRDKAAMAIDLLAIRTAERQAKSQDNHARAMRVLTVVLAATAIVQAFLPLDEGPDWAMGITMSVLFVMVAIAILYEHLWTR